MRKFLLAFCLGLLTFSSVNAEDLVYVAPAFGGRARRPRAAFNLPFWTTLGSQFLLRYTDDDDDDRDLVDLLDKITDRTTNQKLTAQRDAKPDDHLADTLKITQQVSTKLGIKVDEPTPDVDVIGNDDEVNGNIDVVIPVN